MAGGPGMMPSPNQQVPFYAPPYYNAPMPRPMMPYAMPQMPMQQPIAYVPYYGPPGMIATAQRDPRTGIWQVQNVMPSPSPFSPIPNFNPGMPGAMPTQNGPMGPMNSFQTFGPIQQFGTFNVQ